MAFVEKQPPIPILESQTPGTISPMKENSPDLICPSSLTLNGIEAPSTLKVHDDVPDLSPKRRWAILGIMIVSMFVDVVSGSAFTVFIGLISADLNILFAQQTWIISAYTVTFASFLLFWGRVSDLYAARSVFAYGFIAFGILNLISSFLVEQYSFFIFRAITGIAGSSLVPSAYRLIASNFPLEERGRAYTLYGMTGSIANVSGVLIAGLIALIGNEGQMKDWRWFFRLMAVLSIAPGIAALYAIPKPAPTPIVEGSKWKRFDLIGVFSMLSAVLLLIISLTFGATYGFASPAFIVPLVLSVILFPAFFYWETRLPEGYALIPPTLWRLPNFSVLIVLGLYLYGFWVCNFIPFIEMYIQVHGESIIMSAVRTLPEGVSAAFISVVMLVFPTIISRPRWPIAIGLLTGATALVLWTQTPSVVGIEYWKFVFPGMVIGSAGMQVVLLGTIVGVMLVAPPEQAGVVGAILQTAMHTSTVVSISIQAGLFTVQEGGIHNFVNVRASWYFELGWVIVWLIGFVTLYRPSKNRSDAVVGHVEV